MRKKTPSKRNACLNLLCDHLKGHKFRSLNEISYAQHSQNTFSMFLRNPDLFHTYHEGYQRQRLLWPQDPLVVIAERIIHDYRTRKKQDKKKRRREQTVTATISRNDLAYPTPLHPKKFVIADLGCGLGQLAEMLLGREFPRIAPTRASSSIPTPPPPVLPLTAFLKPEELCIRSFDFLALKSHIEVADTSRLPLHSNSVDVAVFSLSLMGQNYIDSLFEAYRVLKYPLDFTIAKNRVGRMYIAEVASRVKKPILFVDLLRVIGFDILYTSFALQNVPLSKKRRRLNPKQNTPFFLYITAQKRPEVTRRVERPLSMLHEATDPHDGSATGTEKQRRNQIVRSFNLSDILSKSLAKPR